MAHAAHTAVGFQDCRNIWVKTLEDLAEADPRIVAVVNDSVGSSKLNSFQKRFPDRLINVGIAEQVMVGVGAGLANGGRIPFVSAAGCFITGRALEQVKADIAYAGFNVKLVGQSSGIAYGELGATHHSIEDFAWLRPLTNLTVICPADAWETAEAVKWAAQHEGPVYLRLSRMPVPDLNIPNRQFRPGHAEVVREGKDLTIIACGTTVHLAAGAADLLKAEGIQARVGGILAQNVAQGTRDGGNPVGGRNRSVPVHRRYTNYCSSTPHFGFKLIFCPSAVAGSAFPEGTTPPIPNCGSPPHFLKFDQIMLLIVRAVC